MYLLRVLAKKSGGFPERRLRMGDSVNVLRYCLRHNRNIQRLLRMS